MKYVLITGANGGLGFSATKLLVERGYTVFATDINIEDLEGIKNDKLISIQMDVTSDESVKKAFDIVSNKTFELDAIINFAGTLYMDSLIEADLDKLSKILEINITGVARVNKVFFPLVKTAKGRIINISSETAYMTSPPFNGPYTMTKYALEAYNDSLRRELQLIGIKVINLQLGSFKTKMHDQARESFDELKKKTKLFNNVLGNMTKSMDREMNNNYDFKYFHKPLLEALEKTTPKTCYRVKNSKTMGFISLLPEKTIDNIYKKNM